MSQIYKLRDWINPEKFDWSWVSINMNPNAIYLLEQNPEKINWAYLSINSNAIHLLEKNLDKINCYQKILTYLY